MKKLITLVFLFCTLLSISQGNKKVIIDADTGNEVDDLYAIVRGVLEPSWDVLALNGTQWQVSHWAVENSMEESHRLNMMLLAYLNINDIKLCRGSAERLFDWGNKERHSEAAYEIIKQAHKMPKGEKLSVVTLGALTNVASAVLIDPEIEDKIAVYWLGTSYDFEMKKSKRIDFNAVMDVQATDMMLSSNVEMHIIPVNIAAKMKYGFEETEQQIGGKHRVCDFLLNRWENHLDPGRYERTLWDLGIIQALIYPDKVTEIKADSFDNPNIWLYSDVDAEFFKKDFFKTISTIY